MITTLHTPPTPWLESALRVSGRCTRFAAVSDFTARQWRPLVRAAVILNGVDTTRWSPGPGGGPAMWFGRLVPEKAPHLAIEAAQRAGVDLELAGAVLDPTYFAERIAPELGPRVRYLGHLDTAALSKRVGAASVTVVTPDWDEPFGLIAAESMAAGTPVAAFLRGGLGEVITPESGSTARAGDVDGLARSIGRATGLSRERTRAHAVAHCSIESMVDAYERLYEDAVSGRAAA